MATSALTWPVRSTSTAELIATKRSAASRARAGRACIRWSAAGWRDCRARNRTACACRSAWRRSAWLDGAATASGRRRRRRWCRNGPSGTSGRASAAQTASGRTPRPNSSVAPSGMNAAAWRAMAASASPARAGGGSSGLARRFDQQREVFLAEQLLGVRPGNPVVDFGDHRARGLDGGRQVVDRQAHAVFAARVGRADLDAAPRRRESCARGSAARGGSRDADGCRARRRRQARGCGRRRSRTTAGDGRRAPA